MGGVFFGGWGVAGGLTVWQEKLTKKGGRGFGTGFVFIGVSRSADNKDWTMDKEQWIMKIGQWARRDNFEY